MVAAGGSVEAGLLAVLLVWGLGGVIAYAVWRGRNAPMLQAVPRKDRRGILIGSGVLLVVLIVGGALALALR